MSSESGFLLKRNSSVSMIFCKIVLDIVIYTYADRKTPRDLKD